MGYKAGMTHIVRDVDKPGSKLHKKETAEVGAWPCVQYEQHRLLCNVVRAELSTSLTSVQLKRCL